MATFQIPSSSDLDGATRRAVDAVKKFSEKTFLTLSGGTLTGSLTGTAFIGGTFSGDGSALTSLNASSLASGTVLSARISGAYTGITGLGTISGALTATGNIVSTTGAYYSGQSGVSNGGLASYTSYDRSLPYTSSFALYMQSAIGRLYHSGFGDVLQAASTGAVTIPGTLTGNSDITGSRLKTSSNQLDIGSWAANAAYLAISKPDGGANNYLMLADTTTTFISTPSSGGAIYLRPGLNNTTGQAYVTTSGLTCNTIQSDASNNLTLQAGGSNVLVSPSTSLTSIASTTGYQAVYWGTTFGNYARFTSKQDLKENIVPISSSGSIIDALRPVTFIPKATCEETPELRYLREQDVQYGFIAEEVAQVADGKLAVWEPDDVLYAVPAAWKHHDMIALVVAEVKSLRKRVTVLENNYGV